MQKPLLLLDVDGVFSPFDQEQGTWESNGSGHVRHSFPGIHRWSDSMNLHPEHGAQIKALQSHFETVWCTYWEDHANEHILPALGLTEPLPVIHFPGDLDRWGGQDICWKTRRVLEYTDGRPFVWVDDDVSTFDDDFIRDARQGDWRFALVQIDPVVGIDDDTFQLLDHLGRVLNEC